MMLLLVVPGLVMVMVCLSVHRLLPWPLFLLPAINQPDSWFLVGYALLSLDHALPGSNCTQLLHHTGFYASCCSQWPTDPSQQSIAASRMSHCSVPCGQMAWLLAGRTRRSINQPPDEAPQAHRRLPNNPSSRQPLHSRLQRQPTSFGAEWYALSPDGYLLAEVNHVHT